MFMADIMGGGPAFIFKNYDNYLFQFYVIWILRLIINITIELTDYMMPLYLQGVIRNMHFVQSFIPKLII